MKVVGAQAFCAVTLLGLCLAVSPVDASNVPKQSDICVGPAGERAVDKKLFSNFLLSAYGVSRNLVLALPEKDTPEWKRLFVDEDETRLMPTPEGRKPDEFHKKYEQDINALGTARSAFRVFLLNAAPDPKENPSQAYENVTKTLEPRDFLEDDKAALKCLTAKNGEPIEASGAVDVTHFTIQVPKEFRLRGSTDGLYFRSDDPQVKSLDSAAISFSYDGSSNKRLDKLVAVLGYGFVFGPYKLIPYVGTNRNVVNISGKPSTTSTETVDVGVLNALDLPLNLKTEAAPQRPIIDNWVTLRPDYLWNLHDDSRLFTLQFVYTPIISECVYGFICPNSYIMWHAGSMSFRPIVDARLDLGIYTDKGTDTVRHRDYTRLGTQFGLAVTSDNPGIPLDATVTYTFLHGFSGFFGEVTELKASVTWSFNKDKNYGITMSVSNGRREDTAQHEQLWSVALTARY